MNLALIQPTEFARLLQGSQARRVIAILNILLVIWIAAQLATITWDLFPGPDTVAQGVAGSPAGPRPPRSNPDRQLIAGLPSWHLLGVPARDTGPAVVAAPENAPDTQLRLTLRGALASGDRALARAIIADQSGKEDQYAIGSMLPGNAELSEIYPDRVILKRNGRYETLRLPDDTGAVGRAPGLSTAPAALRNTRSPAERLRAVRDQLRNKPNTISKVLRANRKSDDSGNIIGYELMPGTSPDLFREVGFEEGDVVIQINDLSLAEPGNDGKALAVLYSGEPVTLKLLRNGQEQNMTLEVPK